MTSKQIHATPERRAFALFLILALFPAGIAHGEDEGQRRVPAGVQVQRAPLLQPVPTSLPVVGGTWTAQGAAPIQSGQVEGITNQPVAGAINTVVAHPTDANTLWAGSVNGGIWKTTNATSASPTWTPQTDAFSSLSISDMQRDPTDATHNTLVASTGGYSSWGVNGPTGSLLRTTNGGTTWSALNPSALNGFSISGIAPRGSTIVVSVANCGPIYRSTDTGASFSLVAGLPSSQGWDLAGDPTNTAVLYAAITECSGTTLSGVYKSTNTGASWTRVSSATMNSQLNGAWNAEISVGASGQIYVAIVSSSGQLSGIFRSGNGGSSWSQLDNPATIENGNSIGIHPGYQGSLHLSLVADPTNVNLVYIGGDRQPLDMYPNSLGAYNYSGRLFRVNAAASAGTQATSLTHCQTATTACNGSVSTSNNSAPHADSRAMVFDANGNLLETDDGGIYRRTTPSGTGDWFSVIGNLQITEMHDVVFDGVSNMIMSGNQDTGTSEQTSVGGSVWSQVSQGDGGDASADDASSSTQSIRYSSYYGLGGFLRRYMNGSGVMTSYSYPSLTVISGPDFQGQFDTPAELNRLDPKRILFAGYNDLYESLDRGDTISALGLNEWIRAVVYGGRSGGTDNLDVIYAISATFPGTVYVRTSGSGAPVATTSQPTTGYLRDIAADVNDWQKAYVLTSAGTVYATSNNGASWTNVTGNLGSGSTDLWTIVHIPANPSMIAVGGTNGVFVMNTSTPGVWNQLGTGSSNAIVYDLDYDVLDDTLVAGTLGRGAWKLSPVVVTGPLPSLSINDVTVTEGNSGTTNATFTVSLSAAAAYTVGVDYATADGTTSLVSTTFSNPGVITIQDVTTATPYPSTIAVSGLTASISKVTVTLNDFRHTYPSDVDVLLVGPGGQSVVLMSDTGGGNSVSSVDLTFDDAAGTSLTDFGVLASGTFRPTNYGSSDSFSAPAPAGPYGSALSVFNGTSVNGTWSLYVVDDVGGDVGAYDGGWSLTFSSGDYAPTSGSLIFAPGTTSRTITVPVSGDTTTEPNETFFVNLSHPSNATIADSQGQGTITNDDGLGPPANVVATATTVANVSITWSAAPGASTYHVYRSTGGAYTQIGVTAGLSLNDATVSANTSYLYKVRSFAGTESADSNVDLATTVIFTDPVLTVDATSLKAVHFTELLTAVNAVRALAGAGYPAIAFTPPAPGVGIAALGIHVTDLRNGLNPARVALGLAPQGFTDPALPPATVLIKAIHVDELRSGVR